jgi:hypothetical protein
MRNTADVTGGKPIAVLLQSISGVSDINPLVAILLRHPRRKERGAILLLCPELHTRLKLQINRFEKHLPRSSSYSIQIRFINLLSVSFHPSLLHYFPLNFNHCSSYNQRLLTYTSMSLQPSKVPHSEEARLFERAVYFEPEVRLQHACRLHDFCKKNTISLM